MSTIVRNYLRGAGSVLDLVPSCRRTRVGRGIDLNRSDVEALLDDWRVVASDFRSAFDSIVKEVEDGRQEQKKQA